MDYLKRKAIFIPVNLFKLNIMKTPRFFPLIAGILCILLASCSDDDARPENYVFSHIEFFEESSRQIEEKLIPTVFENPTEATITYDATTDPKTKVVWESNDPQAFNIESCDSLLIYYLGDSIYYSEGYSEYPGSLHMKESTIVPPYTQMTYEITVYYEEIFNTYLLTLKDEFSEKTKQFKGKLTYTKALYAKSNTVVEPFLPSSASE